MAEDDNLKNFCVLVVDDDPDIGKIIEAVLRDLGIGRVRRFEDGGAALLEFCDNPDNIDIIICDWMMPGMTGLDVLKGVRALSKTVPFMMLTAKVTEDSVTAAKQHGVSAYVRKPFTVGDLQKKLGMLIERVGVSAKA